MAEPKSFVDNLKNLRLVMSVALEHIQENRNQFVKSATGNQVRQVEKSISQIRAFADRIETEFNTLEYLVSSGPPRPLKKAGKHPIDEEGHPMVLYIYPRPASVTCRNTNN